MDGGGDTDGWRRRHGWMEAATRMDGGGDTDGWRRRHGWMDDAAGWMEAATRMNGGGGAATTWMGGGDADG